MSSDIIENNNLTKEEKHYNDCIRRGDDFFRIELFKSSKEMFEEALKLKPGDEYSSRKINECKSLIRRDTKRILVVLPILIIIVFAVIYYRVN